jgi:hypothetical protein
VTFPDGARARACEPRRGRARHFAVLLPSFSPRIVRVGASRPRLSMSVSLTMLHSHFGDACRLEGLPFAQRGVKALLCALRRTHAAFHPRPHMCDRHDGVPSLADACVCC